MCVYYINLNLAFPKDLFPLLNINKLVDNSLDYKIFSLMNLYSRCNQIHRHKKT